MATAWANYKAKMTKKRGKTKKDDSSRNMEELVVQRLSSSVSGKAQKYTRVGAREFVPFGYDEVTIPNIKLACTEHYGSLIGDDMEVDVLAGEQGPSCQSMKHVKDLRLIYIRFIKRETLNCETSTSFIHDIFEDSAINDNNLPPGKKSKRICISDSSGYGREQHLHHKKEEGPCKEDNVSVYPKSLSIADMLKLGKVVEESPATVIEVSTFCASSMSWSKVTQSIEFIIEKKPLGEGGFRQAFKASCSTSLDAFSGKSWVVKKFLPKTLEAVKVLKQTPEEHARRVVQMHCLARYFAQQFAQRIAKEGVTDKFGESFVFKKVFLGVTDTGECITIEEFIDGIFTKYINNTGFLCVPEENVIGKKSKTFVHFSHELSEARLMVVDIQGSDYTLYDPEIATDQAFINDELLFCAGNLNVVAISNFKSQHKCNMFCKMLHLSDFSDSE